MVRARTEEKTRQKRDLSLVENEISSIFVANRRILIGKLRPIKQCKQSTRRK